MAKKVIKEKSIEETLWESANKLRGSVEPSEYKHVVLSLIFLKYANDRFEERRNALIADGKSAFIDQAVFYNAKNVFYIEEQSRWSFIMENAKQNDIAIKIPADYISENGNSFSNTDYIRLLGVGGGESAVP